MICVMPKQQISLNSNAMPKKLKTFPVFSSLKNDMVQSATRKS